MIKFNIIYIISTCLTLPGCEPAEASDAESIYESRKLLIRQIQGQIAKQVHEERDSVSEYDSWSDLEDNFALAYEPIPLNIKLETWRRIVLETKVIRMFPKISQSRRRPLLGPSPG